MIGKIVKLDIGRGFGFARATNSQSRVGDVFVHHRDFVNRADFNSLALSALVQFDVVETEKGLRATHIELV